MTERVVTAPVIVAGDRVLRPGWMRLRDGWILQVGQGAPSGRDAARSDLAGTVVPGFVDLHVHGGGGASYTDGRADKVAQAARFHLAHGTTTTLTSTVSTAPDALVQTVGRLADMAEAGISAGIHLEGPWISPQYCGAHDPRVLRDPDRAEIDRVLAAGRGTIAMVTLAPELPGALEAVRRLTSAGVLVAVGHTAASYTQTVEAVGLGARVATHLFNAMAPLHHREPGPVAALLEDPQVLIEVVGDGVHLHPALVRQIQASVGFRRIALVTDAMAAAGMGDGDFRLGGLDVQVRDGVARLRDGGAIAGSTATMGQLFRSAAHSLRTADATLLDPVLIGLTEMTAGNQARVLRRTDIGVLEPGRRADFVVLDDDFQVTRVHRVC
ncbi:N-acetylglucosamine-6-phosphate deacetylase [Gordonia hirsuta DSM 44140 = NBRC 16056]|uniref:N-acetylglucosamine-6-phosphate deacetylase n=1 Tax=Gordonia hirsuta DSM 44140 = NBRC 16056 TaxID=1121927 RepID=L7LC82_9ACTN|nr:N-acetylglucosamine-6-phosphate deacetylase [Gordonia hirsuta]GAC57687.1 N-acetylglucosamine-6-phosphate deacetylase [Gordonia hirsuta DSM 44140 = NBRC 16056]